MLSPKGAKENLAHTAANLVIHVIFSTKERRPFIVPEIRNDLLAYLGGIVRELGGTALIINGTADHVHMLMRIRPAQTVAEVMRVVKPAVSRYIANQEGHHRKRSFQEEFVAFLKKNKIPYDERHIWD